MAFTLITPTPTIYSQGRSAIIQSIPKFPQGKRNSQCGLGVRRKNLLVVAMATGDKSDPSPGSVLESIKTAWDNAEDRIAIAGLGFAAIAALWASSNLIVAIDQVPFIPNLLEVVGLLFSWWFIYRFLLFKPDRQELAKKIKDSISEVTGK